MRALMGHDMFYHKIILGLDDTFVIFTYEWYNALGNGVELVIIFLY